MIATRQTKKSLVAMDSLYKMSMNRSHKMSSGYYVMNNNVHITNGCFIIRVIPSFVSSNDKWLKCDGIASTGEIFQNSIDKCISGYINLNADKMQELKTESAGNPDKTVTLTWDNGATCFVNFKYLEALANALSGEILAYSEGNQKKPVYIRGDHGEAVLMPIVK